MSRNAFLPEDWDRMTAERRRAYVSHLIGVREKLQSLRDASADGEALCAVIKEVQTALAELCSDKSPGERDEA